MNSADQNRPSLVYADGYSYTEIFQTPDRPGISGGDRLISVFHAFFTADRDNEACDVDSPGVRADAIKVPSKVV
ncbi:hypothetical protein [Pseudomonas sp. Q2-TVG4-2]|uniref:hypothetical protein n=1 Tax=Pseudomonas sp. Q2-TVG4-2 TaxID=1685699 RepID=UPI0015E7A0A6|nr:hypothetical protein [Pseudomonas sp. Q2-TVG4-2]